MKPWNRDNWKGAAWVTLGFAALWLAGGILKALVNAAVTERYGTFIGYLLFAPALALVIFLLQRKTWARFARWHWQFRLNPGLQAGVVGFAVVLAISMFGAGVATVPDARLRGRGRVPASLPEPPPPLVLYLPLPTTLPPPEVVVDDFIPPPPLPKPPKSPLNPEREEPHTRPLEELLAQLPIEPVVEYTAAPTLTPPPVLRLFSPDSPTNVQVVQ